MGQSEQDPNLPRLASDVLSPQNVTHLCLSEINKVAGQVASGSASGASKLKGQLALLGK